MDDAPAPLDLGGRTRVILFVTEFDAAVAFYRDALGLPLAYPPGGGWAEFATQGTCALCLHAGRSDTLATEHIATYGWVVGDLDAAVAALRARGVEVHGPHPVTDGKRAATFHDPSANALFLEGA